MKKKSKLLIVFAMNLLLVLSMSFDAAGQRRVRQYVADSGIVTLAMNQKLRVAVSPKSDNETIRFRIRRCTFTSPSNGVLAVNSSEISPFMTLPPTEGRFFDIFVELSAVRFRVGSNSPNMIVTYQVINTTTGEVVSSWIDGGISAEDDWESPTS